RALAVQAEFQAAFHADANAGQVQTRVCPGIYFRGGRSRAAVEEADVVAVDAVCPVFLGAEHGPDGSPSAGRGQHYLPRCHFAGAGRSLEQLSVQGREILLASLDGNAVIKLVRGENSRQDILGSGASLHPADPDLFLAVAGRAAEIG